MCIDGQISEIRDLTHIPKHFHLRWGFENVVNFVNRFQALQRRFVVCAFDAAKAFGRTRRVQALH